MFGTIHRDQHSDSILNVLISLQRWTPFVWEQDRFGMLVPLLAVPIKHPLANLLFQAYVSTFAGLATFYLLARFAFRDASYPLVGTIGAASILTLTPPYYRFEYLVDTSYATSLALALWALILIEPEPRNQSKPKLVAALVLMVLSHWVNCVTAFFLGPVVFLRWCRDVDAFARSRDLLRRVILASQPLRRMGGRELARSIFAGSLWLLRQPLGPYAGSIKDWLRQLWQAESFRGLVILAIGYEFGQLFIALCPYQPTTYSSMPMNHWVSGWWTLLQTNAEALGRPRWVVLMAIELVVGLAGLIDRGRWRTFDAWWAAGSLILTAVTLWLLMGTRTWTWINAYAFRYLYPSALLFQTAVAGLAVAALRAWIPPRPKPRFNLLAVSTLVLWQASNWSYGVPSMAVVRRDIDRQCGGLTDDILASRSTCLAGNYWKVWTSVFHVNLVLYEKGERRKFWGLTFRATPTLALWKDEPIDRCRAAVPVSDPLGDNWLKSYGMPRFELIEIRPTIRVYQPIPVAKRDP